MLFVCLFATLVLAATGSTPGVVLAQSAVLMGDVTFSTEGIAVITTLLMALGGTVIYLHKALVAQTSAEKETWKNIAVESAAILDAAAMKHAAAAGRPPRKRLALPVPEHNSAITQKQRDTAELTGARAALVASRKELGIPPRTEQERPEDLVKTLYEDWGGIIAEPPPEVVVLSDCTLEVPKDAKVTLEVKEDSLPIVPKEKEKTEVSIDLPKDSKLEGLEPPVVPPEGKAES